MPEPVFPFATARGLPSRTCSLSSPPAGRKRSSRSPRLPLPSPRRTRRWSPSRPSRSTAVRRSCSSARAPAGCRARTSRAGSSRPPPTAPGRRPGARVVGHPPHSGWAQLAAVPHRRAGDRCPRASPRAGGGAAARRPDRAAPAARVPRPPPGRRMLVTGASGGVGHFVTELAAAAGADVTVQSRSPERLLKLGATAADRGHARTPQDRSTSCSSRSAATRSPRPSA